MEDKTKNHLRTLSIATFSVLPMIGGPLSVFLDSYLPKYIEEKRNSFLLGISKEIQNLEDENFELFLNDDKFNAIFLKVGRIIVEEIKEEKIIALRNIILNVSVSKSIDFDETTLFINWINNFTADQIRIIKAIKNIDEVRFHNTSKLENALYKIFPNVKLDYLTICSRDLSVKNIIKYNPKQKQKWIITGIGERFLKYIEFPIQK